MPTLKDALSQTPWRDKEGLIRPNTDSPATTPALALFNGGNIYGYQFGVGDELDLLFHVPHDWIVGSDLYIHLHWGHNAASIAAAPNNDIQWEIYAIKSERADGAPSAVFSTEEMTSFDVTGMTIADYPRYCHVVTEIILANSGKTGDALFDSALMDADGLIMAHIKLSSTVPTGMTPFIFTADLHYQSDGSGDKNKDPDYNA